MPDQITIHVVPVIINTPVLLVEISYNNLTINLLLTSYDITTTYHGYFHSLQHVFYAQHGF